MKNGFAFDSCPRMNPKKKKNFNNKILKIIIIKFKKWGEKKN